MSCDVAERVSDVFDQFVIISRLFGFVKDFYSRNIVVGGLNMLRLTIFMIDYSVNH